MIFLLLLFIKPPRIEVYVNCGTRSTKTLVTTRVPTEGSPLELVKVWTHHLPSVDQVPSTSCHGPLFGQFRLPFPNRHSCRGERVTEGA